MLFPHLARLSIERVFAAGTTVRVRAGTYDPAAVCPAHGTVSGKVHSRYERRLADTAIAGRETMLELRVRRFFCVNPDCAKKTFAEQVPGRHRGERGADRRH